MPTQASMRSAIAAVMLFLPLPALATEIKPPVDPLIVTSQVVCDELKEDWESVKKQENEEHDACLKRFEGNCSDFMNGQQCSCLKCEEMHQERDRIIDLSGEAYLSCLERLRHFKEMQKAFDNPEDSSANRRMSAPVEPAVAPSQPAVVEEVAGTNMECTYTENTWASTKEWVHFQQDGTLLRSMSAEDLVFSRYNADGSVTLNHGDSGNTFEQNGSQIEWSNCTAGRLWRGEINSDSSMDGKIYEFRCFSERPVEIGPSDGSFHCTRR